MPRVTLTRRLIEHTPLPTTGELTLWDEKLPGLGLRLWPGGRRSFCVRYRFQGKHYRLALGTYGVLSVEDAREDARQVLAAAKRGEDPALPRRGVHGLTVAELATRYLQEHGPKLKPETIRTHTFALNTYILPALGKRLCTEVTHTDISLLHHEMGNTPPLANRTAAVLSHLFTMAERWGLRPRQTNPVYGLVRYKEKRRERFLTDAELFRLERVLEGAVQARGLSPEAITAIRLLLETGCRVNEILRLAWQDVDMTERVLRLRDSKTGPRTVYLSLQAQAILRAIPHLSPWVLPGMRPGDHIRAIYHPWNQVRHAAGIPDVRLHDLRHTYASWCIKAGIALPIVKVLMGHRDIQSTMRYIHLDAQYLKEASSNVGDFIERIANG
jgi:integrase